MHIVHCQNCGGQFETPYKKLFCNDSCRREFKAKTEPAKACLNCGNAFETEGRIRKYCSPKCAQHAATKRWRDKQKPKDKAASASTPQVETFESKLDFSGVADDPLAYILSDTIHGAAIAGELELLGEHRKRNVADLKARLLRELLATAVWPRERAGRLALALFLIETNTTARFRHAHEKIRAAGQYKPSRLGRIIG